MPKVITEADIEKECLNVLYELGYTVLSGADISEDGAMQERKYDDPILPVRLKSALKKINPSIPEEALESVIKQILKSPSQNIIFNNQHFHKLLVNGVDVSFRTPKGAVKHDKVWLIDFNRLEKNDFLAVNQLTVCEQRNKRRLDIALFVNGLPLVVIELKNPADENADIWTAYNQLETYKKELPSFFQYNEILVISDGFQARAGTINSGKNRFVPWKTIEGVKIPESTPQLQVLLKGMLKPEVLLDLVKHFIVFEPLETNFDESKNRAGTGEIIIKKIAAYHQFNAVNKALHSTIRAIGKNASVYFASEEPENYGLPSVKEQKPGDRRAGVVWHTQGSGKSLTMVFYVGKLVLEPALENPTVIILTDRNDLDDQLFGTFCRCKEILRQEPKQASSREELKNLLKVASGGIIFTTIQKFLPDEKGLRFPLLSERSNIVVIADEAHRSQYDFIDGFARHMRDALPNATFIGFTGTPIEKADRSTPAVFGNYVDIYDIEQAVEDQVTVKIYYESRLAKLELNPEERPHIDKEFEEVTEGEEIEKKERLKSKWAQLEKLVGSPSRIKQVAADIVSHWEQRQNAIDGKAMIVCMSRRICVELHNEIIKLRPQWYHKDDDKGVIKVIMTGSASDPPEWQEHIRNKERRKAIGDRLKDPDDPLKIVIVRDMWLTGFDAPPLHTMYIDKPMKGHTLMQAIARVNRVFEGKPGGLVVDYIGIGVALKEALAEYTEGDKKQTAIPQEEAVNLLKEEYDIVAEMFYGFNYKRFFEVPASEKMTIIVEAIEHILKEENGKERFLEHVMRLHRAFALAAPHPEALAIKDDLGFFLAVRSAMIKTTETKRRETYANLDSAIEQILTKAIVSDKVIDIFAAAGLKKPDISILSEEFLEEVKQLPHKNLAIEMLKKLLNEEIKTYQRKNLVKSRSFAELLEKAIRAYTNKTIETAQVIEELIQIAKKIKKEHERIKNSGFTEEEIAFYDALVNHEGVREVMGDEKLMIIARELVKNIQKNVTIDWTMRESAQAKIRVMVKRILRKYGYPPDKCEKATETVIEQTKLFCDEILQHN